MYEILKDGVVIARTDAPNFIRRHEDGFYILCSQDEACGVAVRGVPYALGAGMLGECEPVTLVQKDGGVLLDSLQAQAEATARMSGQTAVAAKLSVQDSTAVTDDEALLMPDMFRTWDEVLAAVKQLVEGRVVAKDGKLYRVLQPVMPQAHQPPDGAGMLAIYRPIDPTHTGTREDPIPWQYGMDCETGKYYLYSGTIWLCDGDMKPCVWAPGSPGVWQWKIDEEAVL